jgi:hypothetical protein
MNNVIANVVNTVSGDVNAEVATLRDEAHTRIQAREIARSYVNTNLSSMPVLIGGTHIVGYKDSRGDKVAKEQAKNLSLWTVSLQTVIERGHASYQFLGAMFQNWAKECLGVTWELDSAKRAAKLYCNSMQDLSILSSLYSDYEYINETTGLPAVSRVFRMHDDFEEVYNKLYKSLCENAHYVCRPLYNKPSDWVNQYTGIGERAGLVLVKGGKHTKIADAVLCAVNKLQSVQFHVPDCIIDAAHDLLDNQHEFSSTPEELMMYGEICKYANTEFYFPVTMDSRGRMYYRGGLLSPQGTDFCKAAFQFVVSAPLGDSGLDAISVHLANQLGHDKLSINDRLSAIAGYIDSGTFDDIEDHLDVSTVFPRAKTFQALVAIRELKYVLATMKTGVLAADVMSDLVCHQDGTCNGLQHMSAITHNRQTAIATNCTASDVSLVPCDIYGLISNAAVGFAKSEVVYDLIAKYGRDMAKNPVMIVGYGAGDDTVKRELVTFLADHGEGTLHAADIGDCYIAAINVNAGAVKALTAAIKARVKAAMKAGQDVYEWTTADGFKVSIAYQDIEPMRIRAGAFNALMRDVVCVRDDIKTVGAMAPNFIHSIDATHLRMVVNACDWDLVTVHDSIGSRPCDYFATGAVIREQFAKLHEYDAIGNLCTNMGARKPKFRGDYVATEALEATYMFS